MFYSWIAASGPKPQQFENSIRAAVEKNSGVKRSGIRRSGRRRKMKKPMKNYQLTEGEYKRILAFKRDLHMHPELGFDMAYTKPYLKAELEKMGYEVKEMGKAGLVVEVGPAGGKTVLLRGDLDALPLDEETDVE
jgi:hypothetical protein